MPSSFTAFTRSADTPVGHGAASEIVVVVIHGLFVEAAVERLSRAGIGWVPVTDTLAQSAAPAMSLGVCSVAPLLADAIGRLHHDEPLDDLLARA
ncbi:hypothetical protein [Nonomuraea sp. CA-141351]|uniref:hypothetical protein n=1 Tax=Nonomuraea sp. CA-141351 TaxID=3239996 RepID=UPI003D90E563